MMSTIKRVFIIDDDPIFIYGMRRLMKEMGFCDEILACNDVLEAQEKLADIDDKGLEGPTVIFLDLNMPMTSGWDFLDTQEKLAKGTGGPRNIYVVSSSMDPRDVERSHDYASVKDYLIKPINLEVLESIRKSVK